MHHWHPIFIGTRPKFVSPSNTITFLLPLLKIIVPKIEIWYKTKHSQQCSIIQYFWALERPTCYSVEGLRPWPSTWVLSVACWGFRQSIGPLFYIPLKLDYPWLIHTSRVNNTVEDDIHGWSNYLKRLKYNWCIQWSSTNYYRTDM